jgi:hypothetical protein
MKSWISAAWSFAAGTLVGAIIVLALVASTGIPKLNAEASGQRRPMTVNSTGATGTSGSPLQYEAGVVAHSAPVLVERDNSRSRHSRHTGLHHSECDLQLD